MDFGEIGIFVSRDSGLCIPVTFIRCARGMCMDLLKLIPLKECTEGYKGKNNKDFFLGGLFFKCPILYDGFSIKTAG